MRALMRFPSTTTGSSLQMHPAFSMSSRIAATLVAFAAKHVDLADVSLVNGAGDVAIVRDDDEAFLLADLDRIVVTRANQHVLAVLGDDDPSWPLSHRNGLDHFHRGEIDDADCVVALVRHIRGIGKNRLRDQQKAEQDRRPHHFSLHCVSGRS